MDEWVPAYITHVGHELRGVTLVCDCEHGGLCEADLLAGMVFDAMSPSNYLPKVIGRKANRSNPRQVGIRAVSLAGAIPGTLGRFRQEDVILAFKKLYRADWFTNFRFPMVEDLINQEPFICFRQWLCDSGKGWDGPLVPLLASQACRWKQKHADGQQMGALSHRAALPPLVSFGLSM